MKTTIKIAILAMIGMSLSAAAQDEVVNGKLTVKGKITLNSTDDQVLHLRPNKGYSGYIYWAEDGIDEKGVLGFEKGSKDLVYSSGGWNFTNSTERFRIQSNGNIGVGTSNPQHLLHIHGTNNPTLAIGKLNKNTGGKSSLMFFAGDGATANNAFTVQYNKTNSSDRLSFMDGGNVESLSIINGGNIGVGTTNPDMKLTVKGNIHAEEVKIDLNTPAPDYVFKKDYNLRSIEDLEDFIRKNNHLPEIPSGKEFQRNGILQGQMDMSLLKKIEELTLYTIQQEKKMDLQDLEIKELKKKNQQLTELNKKIIELQSRLDELEARK